MDYNIGEQYIEIIKSKVKQADFDGALEYAGKLLEYDPKSAVGHYFKGLCYYGMDELIYSVDEYVAALELDPGYGRAYFNMALSKFRLGIPKEAMENLYSARDIFMRGHDQEALDRCCDAIETLSEGAA